MRAGLRNRKLNCGLAKRLAWLGWGRQPHPQSETAQTNWLWQGQKMKRKNAPSETNAVSERKAGWRVERVLCLLKKHFI